MMSRSRRWLTRLLPPLVLGGVLAAGCAPRNSLVRSQDAREGRVFLIRGLINIYSLGMDSLAAKLREKDVDARPCQWMSYADLANYLIKTYQAGNHEPICLVGHSQGVDDAIRVARELKKHDIPVALLVSLEEWCVREIPSNVQRVVTIHKRDSGLHYEEMDGELGQRVRWRDVDLRKNPFDRIPGSIYHLYIDVDPRVHNIVIEEVLQTCRQRSAAAHGDLSAAPSPR